MFISKRNYYKYEDYHKIVDGLIYKKCTTHCVYFPNESEWMPCNTEYFYENKKNTKDGLYPYCKKCNSTKFCQWAKDNPEIHNERNRVNYSQNKYNVVEKIKKNAIRQRLDGYTAEWRKNNPDKNKDSYNKHRNHDVSKKEEQAMLKVFEYKCSYCGMTLDDHKKKFHQKLHNDHVDDNGYNDLRNDVPACKPCNSSKHTSNMEEWFRQQTFFSEERLQKIKWWITEGYRDYIEKKLPYRRIRKRIYNNNDSFYWQYELWLYDEKRNLVDYALIANDKREIDKYIKEHFSKLQ